jgi:polysaccharide biosynthesis/export protein
LIIFAKNKVLTIVYRLLSLALIAGTLSACKGYKQHYMFKIEEGEDLSFLSAQVSVAEKNYRIQPYDWLEVRVYTNKGERLIDPNFELQTQGNVNRQMQDSPRFLVMEDGRVNLPMIGYIELQGLTLDEAKSALEQAYALYYKEPFVRIEYLNKRAVVLGATGGQVIPLANENTNLLEVLALAGGIDREGKAHNIRLIRGDLHQPEVFLIDLSTLSGMRTAMLDVRPGDIVYVEPVVRLFDESLRDITTILALVANIVTLILVINNL